MNTKSLFFTLLLLIIGLQLKAQPPGGVSARPNMNYWGGGSCSFYDVNSNLLLTVNAAEAGWSSTPAKTRWVVVANNAGYFEFPNYAGQQPLYSHSRYMRPFWKSDTIFNELVLLSGINSTAKLMFNPQQILSVTNYDFSQTFVNNTDYTINGRTITQKSAQVSATYLLENGKKGDGSPNGLVNVRPTSWTCVSYIPNRTGWGGGSIFSDKSSLLSKTSAKLRNGQPLIIQAFGMSITAGQNVSAYVGDANNFVPTKPFMRSYPELMRQTLEDKFMTDITLINGSCGGKTAAWIDQFCMTHVVPNNPDLVLLDMGMNDIWGNTTSIAFKTSMQSCINKIKTANPNTEFVLIGNMLPDVSSPGPPANGAALMYGFLTQLKSLETTGVAVFDMTTMSDTIYKRKDAAKCLSNALHPNDYLARWYAHGLVDMFGEVTSIFDKITLKTGLESNLNIFPNPFNSQIYINSVKTIARIKISGMGGQTIINTKVNQKKYVLDAANIASGSYILEAIYNDGSKEKSKLIKQ